MPDCSLEHVGTVVVDTDVIRATLRVLRHFGSHDCEGLVLWVGTIEKSIARVTRVLVPDQSPMKSEDGVGYFVSAEALFELNKALSETGLRLIAQVHSHPGEAYHSPTDDRYAIVTANGGLSLVVPNFGCAPADLTAWAVYRLTNGLWHELGPSELQDLFIIGAAA